MNGFRMCRMKPYNIKLKEWAERRRKMRKMLDGGASKSEVARAFKVSPARMTALFPGKL